MYKYVIHDDKKKSQESCIYVRVQFSYTTEARVLLNQTIYYKCKKLIVISNIAARK